MRLPTGANGMIQRSEALIGVLSRAGPGCLPLRTLRRELARQAPGVRWSEDTIRRTVRTSDGRVRILELPLDAPPAGNGATGERLAAWLLATEPEERNGWNPLAEALWRTLATLGRRVDQGSRVSVCRWMLKAEEAVALFRLLHERGPPPTTRRLRPPPSAKGPGRQPPRGRPDAA